MKKFLIPFLCITSLAFADVKKTPDVAYTELASAYLSIGQPAESLENITKALKYNPSNASAMMVRGLTYASINRFDEARHDLEQSYKMDPNNLDIQNNYGYFLCQTKTDVNKGKNILERLTNDLLYKTPEMALINLSRCVTDYESKIQYLFKAISLRPENLDTRLELLNVYSNFEKHGQAAKLVQLLLKKWPKDLQVPAKVYFAGYQAEKFLKDSGKESENLSFYRKQLETYYSTSVEYLQIENE